MWPRQLLNGPVVAVVAAALAPLLPRSSGSQAAVSRLKQLHANVQEGSWMPAAAWTQLGQDLKTLTGQAQQQRKLQQAVEVNIQRQQQAVYRKLAQLQSNAAGGV